MFGFKMFGFSGFKDFKGLKGFKGLNGFRVLGVLIFRDFGYRF
jgi:hypothetical protein